MDGDGDDAGEGKKKGQTRIDGSATAHDAGEGDLLVHVVRRAPAGPLAELACLDAVAPRASLRSFHGQACAHTQASVSLGTWGYFSHKLETINRMKKGMMCACLHGDGVMF